MANTYGKVSGTFQEIENAYGKVSGTWQEADEIYAKVSGRLGRSIYQLLKLLLL
jgi:hypothetical protein